MKKIITTPNALGKNTNFNKLSKDDLTISDVAEKYLLIVNKNGEKVKFQKRQINELNMLEKTSINGYPLIIRKSFKTNYSDLQFRCVTCGAIYKKQGLCKTCIKENS